MPHYSTTSSPTRATLHLVFRDVSCILQTGQTSVQSQEDQIIRVVEEIRSDKVYRGKIYKGNDIVGSCTPKEVIVKVAGPTSEPRAFERLEWEHKFYTKFSKFQGTVFPVCFGLFKAHDSAGKSTMLCLVLERCIPSPSYDKDEFNRQLMLSVCKLHEANFSHQDLESHSHVLRHGTSPRIVDLSRAMLHQCRGCHPASQEGKISEERRSCKELVKLEKLLCQEGYDFEKPCLSQLSSVSQIVKAGTNYLNKGLEAIMGNK